MKDQKITRKKEELEEPGVAIPPDGGYGWVVLVAAFLISLICDGCMYSFGIILTKLKVDFNASQGIVNLVSALNTGFIFMSGPVIAGFANQFGMRPVIMVGSIIGAAMWGISAFLSDIYSVMMLFGFIGGIMMGCTYIPSVLIIGLYFEKKRGIATGITMAGSGVGAFVFAPLTEYFLRIWDWRYSMIVFGCIVMQCCILGALMKPVPLTKRSKPIQTDLVEEKEKDEPIKKPFSPEGYGGEDVSVPQNNLYTSNHELNDFKTTGTPQEQVTIATNNSIYNRYKLVKLMVDIFREMTNFKLLFQNKQFALITIANFFVFVGYMLPFIYIPIRGKELNIKNISMVLSVIGIVNIPSRIIFGIVADRKWITAFNINTMCFALLAFVNFFYFIFLTFSLQIVYAIVFAIGIAGMNSLTSVYLVELVGLDKLTNSTGIISLFRGLGCVFGPYIGGSISESIGTVGAFFFSSGCFAVGTVIVLFITISKWCRILIRKIRNPQSAGNIA